MNALAVSVHPNLLRNGLAVALAVGALTILNVRAHAADLDPITVSAPVVKTVGRDTLTDAPIQDVTVKAKIAVDAETLRNDSGIVLLNDRVLEAAQKVCTAADPLTQDDGTCIREAVKSAKPQVEAVIANARRTTAM